MSKGTCARSSPGRCRRSLARDYKGPLLSGVGERFLRSPVTDPGESKPAISRHLAKDRTRPLAQTRRNPSNPGGKMKRTTIICASVMALVAILLLPTVASADTFDAAGA